MFSFLHDMDWVLPLRHAWATPIAEGFTFLGYTPFFLIFMPLVYWFWNRALFVRLSVVLVLTSLANDWLKDFWQDPRPAIQYQLDHLRVADSYGRPSGHAQGAAAMWFWLAHELKRRWAWVVAAIIVAGVSFSRLYLGVHDVDDVLTGLALGIAGLFVLAWLLGPRFDFWRRLPVIVHFAAFAALGALLYWTWPLPKYPEGAEDTLLFLVAGYAGYLIDLRLAPAEPVRPAWWAIVLFGTGGVVLLFVLRDAAGRVGAAAHLDRQVVSAMQSVVVGLYVTALAPALFRLLGKTSPSP